MNDINLSSNNLGNLTTQQEVGKRIEELRALNETLTSAIQTKSTLISPNLKPIFGRLTKISTQDRIRALQLLNELGDVNAVVAKIANAYHPSSAPMIRARYFPTEKTALHTLHVINDLVGNAEEINRRIKQLQKLDKAPLQSLPATLPKEEKPKLLTLKRDQKLPISERIRILNEMLKGRKIREIFEEIAANYQKGYRLRVRMLYFPTPREASHSLHVINHLEGKESEIRKRIKELEKLEKKNTPKEE